MKLLKILIIIIFFISLETYGESLENLCVLGGPSVSKTANQLSQLAATLDSFVLQTKQCTEHATAIKRLIAELGTYGGLVSQVSTRNATTIPFLIASPQTAPQVGEVLSDTLRAGQISESMVRLSNLLNNPTFLTNCIKKDSSGNELLSSLRFGAGVLDISYSLRGHVSAKRGEIPNIVSPFAQVRLITALVSVVHKFFSPGNPKFKSPSDYKAFYGFICEAMKWKKIKGEFDEYFAYLDLDPNDLRKDISRIKAKISNLQSMPQANYSDYLSVLESEAKKVGADSTLDITEDQITLNRTFCELALFDSVQRPVQELVYMVNSHLSFDTLKTFYKNQDQISRLKKNIESLLRLSAVALKVQSNLNTQTCSVGFQQAIAKNILFVNQTTKSLANFIERHLPILRSHFQNYKDHKENISEQNRLIHKMGQLNSILETLEQNDQKMWNILVAGDSLAQYESVLMTLFHDDESFRVFSRKRSFSTVFVETRIKDSINRIEKLTDKVTGKRKPKKLSCSDRRDIVNKMHWSASTLTGVSVFCNSISDIVLGPEFTTIRDLCPVIKDGNSKKVAKIGLCRDIEENKVEKLENSRRNFNFKDSYKRYLKTYCYLDKTFETQTASLDSAKPVSPSDWYKEAGCK